MNNKTYWAIDKAAGNVRENDEMILDGEVFNVIACTKMRRFVVKNVNGSLVTTSHYFDNESVNIGAAWDKTADTVAIGERINYKNSMPEVVMILREVHFTVRWRDGRHFFAMPPLFTSDPVTCAVSPPAELLEPSPPAPAAPITHTE